MRRLFPLCCLAAVLPPFGPYRKARGDIRARTDTVRATAGVAAVFGDGETLVVNDGHRYPTRSVFKHHQALAVLARRGLPLAIPVRVRKSDLPSDT